MTAPFQPSLFFFAFFCCLFVQSCQFVDYLDSIHFLNSQLFDTRAIYSPPRRFLLLFLKFCYATESEARSGAARGGGGRGSGTVTGSEANDGDDDGGDTTSPGSERRLSAMAEDFFGGLMAEAEAEAEADVFSPPKQNSPQQQQPAARHTPSLGSVAEDSTGAGAASAGAGASASSADKRVSSPAAMAITEVDDDTTDDSDDSDDSDGNCISLSFSLSFSLSTHLRSVSCSFVGCVKLTCTWI
jgi:hypothetical protein